MSDLAATNCGCNDGCGCNSIIWIIILLSCCGNGTSLFNSNNDGCDNSCIWIILLLLFCGNGMGSGRSGCGCGNNFC